MISLQEVETIHQILINKFGGLHGIRDKDALLSALLRPLQTFDNTEFYPSIIEKASAIIESIIKNHPFIDGNKRTGYVLMRIVLLQNKLDIHCSEEEKYFFVMQIAKGEYNFDEIVEWIKSNIFEIK